jgi:hypothetical protein
MLAPSFGAEVHTDLWGLSPVTSMGGQKYYITFMDDHTRFTQLQILRTKDQALDAYKAFTVWASTQHGARIKHLRSGHGGEYTDAEFTKFLNEQGTEQRLTTHDMPQHNRVAESLNCCLVECVQALLHQSELPKSLWGEAIHLCIWLKNQTSTQAIGKATTPFEQLTRCKPNLAGMPEWGQRVWVHRGSESKLDVRASIAHWVGFNQDSPHAHCIYWPEKGSISVERDIKFASKQAIVYAPHFPILQADLQATATPQPPMAAPPAVVALLPNLQTLAPCTPAQSHGLQAAWISRLLTATIDSSNEDEDQVESELSDLTDLSTDGPSTPIPQNRKGKPAEVAQPTRQSTWTCKPSAHVRRLAMGEGMTDGSSQSFPGWHLNYAGHSATKSTSLIEALAGPDTGDSAFLADLNNVIVVAIKESDGDPKTLSEVQSRSNWPHWKEAMDREIKSLKVAGTWKTVPCLPRKNIVRAKWVFKLKRKANRSIDKYKVRLVARGFMQIYGMDYYDTFSLVACLSSFCVLMALAACFGWELEAFDFNSVYLNGELDENEEIYMQELPGYESLGEFVKLLLKAIYGLKQAVVKWYHVLHQTLTDLGFCVSAADLGVFYARIGENILVLVVHVDDCSMTGDSPKLIALYKHKLNDCHTLTELGPVNWLLGIKVTWDRKA